MKDSLYINSKLSVINKINNQIFIIYVLLIFEGALRKWVFPSLSSALFFVKDPFVLYVYWLAYRNKLLPKNVFWNLSVVLCFGIYLLMSIQVIFINIPVIVGLYGWRNYCFYLPLAIIISHVSRKEDMERIARFTCYVAIPIAILTFIQYKSPADSYINKNVGNNKGEIFTILDGIVRPSGTFSFTTGHSTFVTSLIVMLLYNFFLGKEGFLRKGIFPISLFAFFACLAVSGSRGAYFSVGIIAVFLVVSSFFLLKRKQGFKILFFSFLAIVISAVLFGFVFDQEWENMVKRQELATIHEGSIFTRILHVFIDFEGLLHTKLTFLGSGLGMGSGGGAYLAVGTQTFLLAETEWSRHIMEAGIFFGLLYILYRIFLTFSIFTGAIKSLQMSRNPVPLLFFAFTFPMILVGSMTGNGTTLAYGWLFTGFSLAVNKIYKSSVNYKDVNQNKKALKEEEIYV